MFACRLRNKCTLYGLYTQLLEVSGLHSFAISGCMTSWLLRCCTSLTSHTKYMCAYKIKQVNKSYKLLLIPPKGLKLFQNLDDGNLYCTPASSAVVQSTEHSMQQEIDTHKRFSKFQNCQHVTMADLGNHKKPVTYPPWKHCHFVKTGDVHSTEGGKSM